MPFWAQKGGIEAQIWCDASRRWRRPQKILKQIRALYVPKVNDFQSLEWRFWKSGNMKHPKLHASD